MQCVLTVVCDVHGGAKQLHQLLLVVLKVALHDVHTRTEETLKRSHIQYWGEDERGRGRGWIGWVRVGVQKGGWKGGREAMRGGNGGRGYSEVVGRRRDVGVMNGS